MTSNGVSDVLNSMTLAKGQGTGTVSQADQRFDMLLSSKTAAESDAGRPADYMPGQNSRADESLRSYEMEVTEAGYRDMNRITSCGKTGGLPEEAREACEELEDKVTELLAEKLGMTEEEVLEAMKAMGITFESLLLGNGLTDFVGQLTGVQDATELLFHDNFQELMKQMEALAVDFTEQTGMTPQELEVMLQQLEMASQELPAEEVDDAAQQSDLTQQPTEAVQPEELTEHAAEKIATGQTAENVQDAVNQEEAAPTADDKSTAGTQQPGQEADSQEGEQEKDAQTQSSLLKELQQEEAGIPKKAEPQKEPVQQVTYQTVQQTVTGSVGEQIVQTLEKSFVNVDDIMNQVTEFTRVTVEQAQSSIEMQLNPAHLGKIYLQVVSKEGIITAQLAAQNEAVKEALESQAAVLKENMNQQGLKVEAVEVTIASHEFEQNLENDRQQTEQENGEKQNKQSKRFLSVDQLEELSEAMTEEESLLAKIMLENGNSMDMTV